MNELNESNWAIHSTMHRNRQKYRQLGASLLLTSSFAHHKQKRNQKKKEKLDTLASNNQTYHQEVLTAKKMNAAQETKGFDCIEISLSNIDRLKNHAKKLMNEQIKKLGKENQDDRESPQEESPKIKTSESDHICVISNFRINKKPNKRKIVKGRPDMYAITKKKTFLYNLFDNRQGSTEESAKETIKQLLNKNNLLNLISTKNGKLQQKSFDNPKRYKTIDQGQRVHQSKSFHPRKSLTIIKPAYNFKNTNKIRMNQQICDGEAEVLQDSQFCLKRPKFYSAKTIQ